MIQQHRGMVVAGIVLCSAALDMALRRPCQERRAKKNQGKFSGYD